MNNNERQSKIAAILSMDIQQLRLIKYGAPPVKTYHKEFNSDTCYSEDGTLAQPEERNKEAAKYPPGFITSIVVCHPIGTDVLTHLKEKNNG